jgi:hypothetical protein
MNVTSTGRPDFRLPRMVKAAVAREGTPNHLAERINALSENAGLSCRITRKTIVNICRHPERVRFTLDILTALTNYFTAVGMESLEDKPIFERRNVLDLIAASGRVAFLLGSKPRHMERCNYINRWDNLAMAELLTTLSRSSPRLEYLIEDVLWRWPVTAQALANDRFQMALNDDHTSVISIGSPLASLSSEIMLSQMFGAEAFATPSFGPQRSLLPFYFVWRPQVVRRFRSAFAVTWRDLIVEDRKLAAQVKAGRVSCFFCGRRRYLVPAEGQSWTMPGIIAAQRRAAGNVWIVLAGIGGPATFAAAELVKRIACELPWREGADSDVLWIPVKAKVKTDGADKISGDARRVCSIDFAGNPVIYSPKRS